MRTISFTLVFGFVLFLVVGCSLFSTDKRSEEIRGVDFSELSKDTTALVGTWEWKYTICCYGDVNIYTPSSTGNTKTLIFTDDDTVKVYRNGKLKHQTTYEEYLSRERWGVKGNIFAISTEYIDGPESVYKRRN